MSRIWFLFLLVYFIVTRVDSKESGLKANCRDEVQSFCNSDTQNKKHSLLCLLENENRLGPICTSELSRMKEKMKAEMLNACGEDRNKYCFWVIPGGGRILKCLLEQEKNLSLQCTSLISRFQK